MINLLLGVVRENHSQGNFFLTRSKVGVILQLFIFDHRFISEEMKSLKIPEKMNFSAEALYNLTTPQYPELSPLVAFINGEFSYENTDPENPNIGKLTVSFDVPIVAVEGEKRYLELNNFIKEKPEFKDTLIPVILYHSDIQRSHQDFENEDYPNVIAKAVIDQVPIFRTLTEMKRSSLPMRSHYLFTLSAIDKATQALLTNYDDDDLESQIAIAVNYWQRVCENMPQWNQVFQGETSSGKIREDYICSHAITLSALGHLGSFLMESYPDDWQEKITKIQGVNWLRSNPEWHKGIIVNKRVSKAIDSINFLICYLQNLID